MSDKPCKLTIKLTSSDSFVMRMVMEQIDQLVSNQRIDGLPETSAKVVIEADDEEDLLSIRDALEEFFLQKRVSIESDFSLGGPVVRVPVVKKESRKELEKARLQAWNSDEPIRATVG